MRAPVYSHLTYDIIPNQWNEVDQPDILIVEGVNVLQTGRLPRDGKAVPVVSDFFDFSVYIDAEEPVLRDWYVRRFLALRDTAFHRSHDRISTATRCSPTRKPPQPRSRSGSAPTSPISKTISCRRGRARR